MKKLKTVAVHVAFAAVGAAGLELYGCGGGSTDQAVSSSSSLKIGQMAVAYQGSAKPFVAQGTGSVTVTGMSGVAYSNISIVPAQTLDSTVILYTNIESGSGLFVGLSTVTPGGASTPIAGTGLEGSTGTFTHDGHIIMEANVPGQGVHLYECNYDGSDPVQLNTNQVDDLQPVACSPNDQKIAWDDEFDSLWVSNFNGSSAVKIASSGLDPAFSPDGSTLAFATGGPDGYEDVFTVPVGGGTPTLLPNQTEGADYDHPIWLPNGGGIQLTVNTGSASYLVALTTNGTVLYFVPSPNSPAQDDEATFAPDGENMALIRGAGSTFDIVTAQYTGQNPATLVYGNSLGTPWLPQWSPYPSPQTFVGISGKMSVSAAGFLWGQNGDVFSSMLTFKASTPNSTTITPQTSGAASGELIFDIHAASLTGLKYTNGYYALLTTVLSGPSGTTDALVSFNSATGRVDTIAPFVVTRSTSKPVQQGNQLVFQERFSGVWDGKGKNLAPGGASQIVIDSATGKMVSES